MTSKLANTTLLVGTLVTDVDSRLFLAGAISF